MRISSILKHAGPFYCTSQVDGMIRVYPGYEAHVPEECKARMEVQDHLKGDGGSHYYSGSMPKTWCPVCQCQHTSGFMGRMALANDLTELLNQLWGQANEPKGSKRKQVRVKAHSTRNRKGRK